MRCRAARVMRRDDGVVQLQQQHACSASASSLQLLISPTVGNKLRQYNVERCRETDAASRDPSAELSSRPAHPRQTRRFGSDGWTEGLLLSQPGLSVQSLRAVQIQLSIQTDLKCRLVSCNLALQSKRIEFLSSPHNCVDTMLSDFHKIILTS